MNKKIIFTTIIVTLLIPLVSAADIDLLESYKELDLQQKPSLFDTNVGVDVGGEMYTVSLIGNKVYKIELNSKEEIDYEISTTKEQLFDFMVEYPSMSNFERIKYALKKFDLPLSLMMKIAGNYMVGA